MNTTRNNALQALCRKYLGKLRYMGKKHGIDVGEIIKLNRQEKCAATEHEVSMLSRVCDDERISRTDIPKVLGKSYRQAFEDDDFDKVKKLKHQGIYSKVSAILLGAELKSLYDGD